MHGRHSVVTPIITRIISRDQYAPLHTPVAIFHWAIGFAGGHLCMDAIPLSRLLNRVLPYVNALVGDGVDVTYGLTAQQLLPIFFCLHIGYRNVKELNFHYYTIKNLR
jgi:hypothetical protein